MILETQRLRLREMAESDLDFMASLLGDAEVMRFYPKPLDREGAKDWIRRTLGCYARAGHGFWLVERKETGELLGQVGLLPKEINGRSEVELAYMVHRPFWRQGIASEAAVGCLAYAFGTLHLPRVVCMIRPVNLPSLAVARRLGALPIGETEHLGFLHSLFEYREQRESRQ